MAVSAERRQHQRFDVPCRLRLELPDGHGLRARAINVSDGGAYFVAERVPAVGQEVSVRLGIPRDTANTFFLEQFAAREGHPSRCAARGRKRRRRRPAI